MIRLLALFLCLTSSSYALDDFEIERMLQLRAGAGSSNQTVDFCRVAAGEWAGSCEYREQGREPQTFEDGVLVEVYGEPCQSVRIGQDWADPGYIAQTADIEPSSIARDGKSWMQQRTEYWAWGPGQDSLRLRTHVLARRGGSDPVDAVDVTGAVAIEGNKLIRTYSFADGRRSLRCEYDRGSARTASPHPRSSLAGFADLAVRVATPPAQGECADFSGHWNAKCVYVDEKKHYDYTIDEVVEQDGCRAIKLRGTWMSIGGLRTRYNPQMKGTGVLFTDSSSWSWSADRKRLEYSGFEIGMNLTSGKIEDMRTPEVVYLKDGKLVTHRVSHGTCLFHCVYEKVAR